MQRSFSIFHPLTIYCAFHGFVFVFRPIVAWVMKWFIKNTERSFFILELPVYRVPRWANALTTMVQKARIFVFDAGKVIMMISLLLWALSTYGPGERMRAVTAKYDQMVLQEPGKAREINKLRKTALLENSFAGTLGKVIEPVISPGILAGQTNLRT